MDKFSTFSRQIRGYLSLSPPDVATADGRALDRQRRALLSAAMALISKVVSVGASFVTIPLTLKYLGVERFGIWMTISSVIAMLAFADLGVGNGLLNAVSAANGRDDHDAMRRDISSAAIILTLIASVVMTGFLAAYPYVPWARFFNVQSPAATADAGPAALAFVLCLGFSIPATIVQRVQLGLQMGFVANLWTMAGSLLALAALLAVVHFQAGLFWLVLALAGAPVAAAIANGIVFFTMTRSNLSPRLSLASRDSASKILHLGTLFLVLQIAVALAFLSDNIVISRTLGAAAVPSYAVPEKMFSAISLVVAMFTTPLWPAYGEAIARGDAVWVRRILKKSLLIAGFGAAGLSAVLVVLGPSLLTAWIGRPIAPPFVLLIGLGVWKVMDSIGSCFAAFLNAANVVRMQVVLSSATAISAIVLKVVLARHIGVAGVVWATIITYTPLILLPYSIYLPKLLSKVLGPR